MEKIINILCVGDIIGKKGRMILKEILPFIIKRYNIDFTIVNGENAAGGIGITSKIADEILNYGVDIITTGNHIWRHNEIKDYLNQNNKIIRPLNYFNTYGNGFVFITKDNINYLVINILGVIFMDPLPPPFYVFDKFYNEYQDLFKKADLVIVDFHGEATSEKLAFAYSVVDKVNLVFGTHTHVQTADERLISKKTGFISDIGMTGPFNSIIGMQIKPIIEKFRTNIPVRFKVEEKGPGIFNGCIYSYNIDKDIAINIKRINILENSEEYNSLKMLY